MASCSPKLHVVTFRGVAKRSGMNPYEYNQANIREQCSWTHTDDPAGATSKAIGLVRGVIARTRLSEALEPLVVETTQKALIIGGGVAGLRAAIGLADIGLGVFLVEREAELGGWVGRFGPIYPHERDGRELIAGLIARGQEAARDQGLHRRRSRQQDRQLRQLRRRHSRLHRPAADDPGRSRLDHRGHRLRLVPARRRRVRHGHGRRRHPARIQGVDRRRRGNGPALSRQAGPQPRLHLLRRQPPARRQRVLLALLLHRDGARLDPRRRAGPEDPPVPPVSRHPNLRHLRAALHRGTQGRGDLRQVPRRRAAGRGRGQVRRAGRHRPRPALRRRGAGDPGRSGRPGDRHGASRRTTDLVGLLKLPLGKRRVLQRDPPEAAAGGDHGRRRADRRRLPGTQELGRERGVGSGRGHAERVGPQEGRRPSWIRSSPRSIPTPARGAASASTRARTAPSSSSRSTAARSRRSARPAARAAADASRSARRTPSTCAATPTPRSRP